MLTSREVLFLIIVPSTFGFLSLLNSESLIEKKSPSKTLGLIQHDAKSSPSVRLNRCELSPVKLTREVRSNRKLVGIVVVRFCY